MIRSDNVRDTRQPAHAGEAGGEAPDTLNAAMRRAVSSMQASQEYLRRAVRAPTMADRHRAWLAQRATWCMEARPDATQRDASQRDASRAGELRDAADEATAEPWRGMLGLLPIVMPRQPPPAIWRQRLADRGPAAQAGVSRQAGGRAGAADQGAAPSGSGPAGQLARDHVARHASLAEAASRVALGEPVGHGRPHASTRAGSTENADSASAIAPAASGAAPGSGADDAAAPARRGAMAPDERAGGDAAYASLADALAPPPSAAGMVSFAPGMAATTAARDHGGGRPADQAHGSRSDPRAQGQEGRSARALALRDAHARGEADRTSTIEYRFASWPTSPVAEIRVSRLASHGVDAGLSIAIDANDAHTRAVLHANAARLPDDCHIASADTPDVGPNAREMSAFRPTEDVLERGAREDRHGRERENAADNPREQRPEAQSPRLRRATIARAPNAAVDDQPDAGFDAGSAARADERRARRTPDDSWGRPG